MWSREITWNSSLLQISDMGKLVLSELWVNRWFWNFYLLNIAFQLWNPTSNILLDKSNGNVTGTSICPKPNFWFCLLNLYLPWVFILIFRKLKFKPIFLYLYLDDLLIVYLPSLDCLYISRGRGFYWFYLPLKYQSSELIQPTGAFKWMFLNE